MKLCSGSQTPKSNPFPLLVPRDHRIGRLWKSDLVVPKNCESRQRRNLPQSCGTWINVSPNRRIQTLRHPLIPILFDSLYD
jgi:hypothetical protein